MPRNPRKGQEGKALEEGDRVVEGGGVTEEDRLEGAGAIGRLRLVLIEHSEEHRREERYWRVHQNGQDSIRKYDRP